MKKVLVVDDSSYNRSMLTMLLRKKGFHVETVDNGEDAVRLFEKDTFDVVFLDYIMPKKDGAEALREMKNISSDFIAIMLTSISSELDVQRAKDAGADGYILKPYKPEQIYEILTKFKLIE